MVKKSEDPEKKAVTIRDVARRAGVSPSTVSMVLHNHPSIGKTTRERVLRVQQELDYRPNRYAREFVRSTRWRNLPPRLSQAVFCLIDVPSMFNDPAYVDFIDGVVQECQRAGLRISLRSLDRAGSGGVPLAASLRDGHTDGVIVSGVVDDEVVEDLRQLRVPLVVLGNYRLSQPVCRVELDLEAIGVRLAERLVGNGHRTIAFAAHYLKVIYDRGLFEAVRAQLGQDGRELPDSRVIVPGDTATAPAEFAEAILNMKPRPTALITPNILVAAQCSSELRVRGVRIPEDLEIVTVVNSRERLQDRHCAALNAEMRSLGQAAVLRLLEQARHPGLKPAATVFAPDEWLAPLISATPNPQTVTSL
jgi:DNA-binding LacI/PurR family transcriptional regulator